MAQPASTPKIEELRFKVKTDPKSRLFFPLAEELRRVGAGAEAEQVLRTGLSSHPTYLSAWVSLGRVLREQQKNQEAVEALTKALQLDPGNVVAARLLADAYLALGEKVEAIKKYKLVHALLPADTELEAVIARLDREINPVVMPVSAPEPESEPEPEPAVDESPFAEEAAAPATETEPEPERAPESSPFAAERPGDETSPWARGIDSYADAFAARQQEQRIEEETGDVEPMSVAHEESPFEEPASPGGYGSDAFAVEEPQGMHIARAPLAAEVPSDMTEDLAPPESAVIAPEPLPLEEADIFAPAAAEPFPLGDEPSPVAEPEDFTNTITMADLYARQGLIDDARHIYEHILHRDPANEAVRAKLAALTPEPEPQPEPVASEPVFEAPVFDESAPAEPAPAELASDEVSMPAISVTQSPMSLNRAKIARLEHWLGKVGGGR